MFEDFVDDVIQEAPCQLLTGSAADDDGPAACIEGMTASRILFPTAGNEADRVAAEVAFVMAAHGHADVDLVHVVRRSQHRAADGAGLDDPAAGERSARTSWPGRVPSVKRWA